LESLQGFATSSDPVDIAALQSFLDQWNLARDNRPAFAAFKDELLSEIFDADWPEKMRDRLGLAHYTATDTPIAVALMEYTVGDVLTEAAHVADIAHPFCVPSFLDSKPNSQFFPTPRDLQFGAPMALLEIWSDDMLVAEVLHTRLTYRASHIGKLGQISTKGPTSDLKVLRNCHLDALQVAAVREDFGEHL
jgi:hypothetical protein